MKAIDAVYAELGLEPKTWLVTGVAGFIGSNLLERLLLLGQRVVGLDNFSAGHRENLENVRAEVGDERWRLFSFLESDIRDLDHCRAACRGVDYVLHQAALASVPASIEDPITTNQANIDGFVHMLVAARECGVKRLVYAGSSAIYGNHPGLPKVESQPAQPLSPYAVSKYVNELYADVFARTYGMEIMGLRYFNVFGKRQDPQGAYAAVIPKWIEELRLGRSPVIHGDGETSRDFCHIDNVVQANILAATTGNQEAVNRVYNVAFGRRTTLNELFATIREMVGRHAPAAAAIQPVYDDPRPGDVRHSLADITLARELLGYVPEIDVSQGLRDTVDWYVKYAE